MRSFFVTAVCVLALAASTTVASRNLTMSVRWTYNSTFNDENDIFTSIMLSNVDKRVVFAFSGREAWRPMDSGYIVALSAVTGKPLWLSAKLPGPLTCLLFSETNVSVACLGQNTFAVVNRSTGHILASGYYGVNVTIFNSNMGGAIMRSIDERFVTFLLATNQSVVNATSSHYSVVVFDLANGHIQTVSSTTVKRPLTALWFLDTHRMGASKFRISMLLWTGFEFTVVGQVCNQFGRYTAETGVANLTLDFLLPDDAVNVPGSSASYCRSPQVSANTVGGPTPHSLISINFYGSFDIRTFDTATGQLAAVTSIASSVPSSFNSVGSMWMFHADKQYFVNVIFEDVTPGLIFARMATANTTLWALNVPVIDGMITDDTNNTITMGGLMTSRVTKIAIDTGLVLFSTPLQDTSAISVWMDTAGPYLLDFRGSVLSVIDSVTGALSAQASLVSGPLTGETSSDNAIVKAVHDDDELVVLIGELNQVACLQFN